MATRTVPVRWIYSTPDKPWRTGRPEMAGGLPDVQVTDQRDQTWEGFGGCFNELGWTALSALPAPERRRVLRALFDRAAGEDVRCGAALPPRSFNTFVFAPRSRQREASS